jgi:FkbM family methyltransferase
VLKSFFQGMSPRRPVPTASSAQPVPSGPVDFGGPFFDHLMGRFFQALGEFQKDNFDRERFRVPANYEPSFHPDFQHDQFRFIVHNLKDFERVHALFEDAASRDLYEELMLFRLLGPCYKRLPTNNEQHWALRAAAPGYRTGSSGFRGIAGQLEQFTLDFCGETIELQCWAPGIAWSYLMRQYYFERDGMVVQPSAGDYVIDAGACFGDTALGFAAAAGPEGRVYAFDIMPLHIEVIRANLQSNPVLAPRIEVVEAALADRDDVPLYIHGEGPSASAGSAPSPQPVKVTTIDKHVAERRIPRIDFIKMDIEGAELPALQGAAETLRRWRPRLAISLYHRQEDIFTIPLYLKSLELDYAFYLDHYTIHKEETVLFAAPR